MSSFVFITDLHIKSSSKVRSGDVLDDICNKLNFVIDYCNSNDCSLLIGGDVFDKPSVPDYIKSRVMSIFTKSKNRIYTIPGNHDRLYDNPEYSFKTSYNVLTSAHIFQDLDSTEFLDLDDVILTSHVPVVTRNKPQIVIFHGFLNQDDGRNTFRFTDLQSTDNTLVLLGHDHCVYDDIRFKDNIKIVRPGSFLRGERADAQNRIPQLVHIVVRDGKLLTKKVNIKCRASAEIFKTKTLEITKSQQHATYDMIIEQIKNAQSSDMTLEQALSQVADSVVVNYALSLLSEFNINKQFNNKNL